MNSIIKFGSLCKFRGLFKINTVIQNRQFSYISSEFPVDIGKPNIKYEVTKVPEEWKHVEQALPPLCVPEPTPKPNYASEWKPQGLDFKDKPWFISRTKNHMLPVYLLTTQFGIRRITVIKKIQGDIWLLEKQLREFLEPQMKKPLRSQVNEFVGYIKFYGDHVNAIKYWLMKRNY